MAISLSTSSFSRVQRQINQLKAAGRVISPDTIRSLFEAELNVGAERSAQQRSLDISQGQLDLAKENQAISNRQWNLQYENQVKQAKEVQSAARMQGIVDIGKTALMAETWRPGVITDPLAKGAKALGFGGTQAISSNVPVSGFSVSGATSTGVPVSTPSSFSLGTPAVSTAAPALAASGVPTAAGAELAFAYEGATATGASSASAIAGQTAAAASPGIGGVSMSGMIIPAAVAIAAGYVGHRLGTQWGDERTGNFVGGAASGAAMGFMMIGGAVGALIGGAIGAVGGAISNASVICTELTRQGYIPKRIAKLDNIYRHRFIDYQTFATYRKLATPIVKLMQKSKIVTQIVRPFGVACCYEMASRVTPYVKGRILGKIILGIGIPFCKHLGRINYGLSRRFGKNQGFIYCN